MKYGYPLVEREKAIRDLVSAQKVSTMRLEFYNAVQELPVIEVPIELPKYRLQNGRTASLQLEDIARNHLPDNFYRSDIEADECQYRQHELLRQLVGGDGKLKKAFEKEKKRQLDPILVDLRGFIVNGNRRVCYWRDLLQAEPAEYAHFQVIQVAVLPQTINEQEIRKIESRLQLQADLREDYTWHAEANMYRMHMQEQELDSKGVADNFDLSKRDVEISLRMIELGESYLEWRGTPQQWSLLDQKEFGFRRLVSEEKHVTSLIDKEILHQSAFMVIDGSDVFGDRAWNIIPEIRTSMKDWKKAVQEIFKPEVKQSSRGDSGNPFIQGAKPVGDADTAVATFIREADVTQRALLKDALVEFYEDVADKNIEINRAKKLAKGLKMGLGDIRTAVEHGLVPEANLEGVSETIKEIREHLDRVTAWLKSRQR